MSTQWEEIREVWRQEQEEQEEAMSVSAEVMSYLDKGTGKLDADVAEERRAEMLACLGGIGIAAAVYAFADNAVQIAGAILMGAAAILLGGHVWLSGRSILQPDPTTSLSAYRAAIAAKFDRQIRLLRQGKYWALPVFLGLLAWQTGELLEAIERGDDRLWLGGAFTVLLYAVLIWSTWRNEVKGVRDLERRRDSLLRAFDTGETPAKPPRTYPLGLGSADND